MAVKSNCMRIGILENDKDLRNSLSELINKSNFADVAFAVPDGMGAVEIITESHLDVLVVDEALPFKSGIDIITEIQWVEDKPYVIYTLSVQNNMLINRAIEAGIDEFVIKPYEARSMALRIKNIAKTLSQYKNKVVIESDNGLREKVMEYESYYAIESKRNEEKRIVAIATDMLLKAGFSSRHNGYNYIIYAVKLMCSQWNRPYSLTKDVYLAIQDEFDISYDMTECSIRTAVRSAWKRYEESGKTNNELLAHFAKRPTNHEFLGMLTYLVFSKLTSI